MKVLVLGNDGRAHALVWKLFNSPLVSEIICMPGNGGTGQIAPSVDLESDDPATIARWVFDEGVDIIVPASSRPLQQGVVDEVVAFHVGVCGPSQRSTVLAHSRCRAKEFMLQHQLPTAPGRAFTNLATAEKYLAIQPLPLCIKADHPVAGEVIYHERHAALIGLRDLFAARPLEGPNDGVVIEQYLQGPRVVLSAFTDGRTAVPLLATRLYDKTEVGDQGAFAPGIGAHTGESRFAYLLRDYLHQKFILPTVEGLAKEDLPYWGILGVDCIVTNNGPRLTGLRCSLREGEAQVVLPRLEDDLLPWIQAMISQRLHDYPLPTWSPMPSVGIGLFAQGYPHHFATGGLIQGLEDLDEGVRVFHNATETPSSLTYTPRSNRSSSLLGMLVGTIPNHTLHVAGGHPLTIVVMATTLVEAHQKALRNAERIVFGGRSFRTDIGAKEFS